MIVIEKSLLHKLFVATIAVIHAFRDVSAWSITNLVPPSRYDGAVSFKVSTKEVSFTRLYARPTQVLDRQPTSNVDVVTIQILMSDTGGGHRASANALRDAFDVLYPGQIQCDIVDIYTEYGPFWPYNDYVNMYKFMAKYPITWDIFYQFGATPVGLWLNERLLEIFCYDPFKKCLQRPSSSTGKRADMVVSVHPLCQDIPLKILADLDTNGATRDPRCKKTPFCTVVTDLGSAHPTWFNPGVDKCFVPSSALHKAALERQLRPDQIVQYGLPIRKGFWTNSDGNNSSSRAREGGKSICRDKKDVRAALGLDPQLPTVLVVGGGDGMGGLVEISAALGNALGKSPTFAGDAAYQMVVVCGKNEPARRSLEQKEWGDGVKVSIQGFVNNMDEFMRSSDILVTKAGPGTIAEASICGLPCMLFSFLPGQEAGNIPFVENSGFGAYSSDPNEIAKTVTSWLSSPDKLESMRRCALAASRPEATIDIARDVASIAFAHVKKQPSLVSA